MRDTPTHREIIVPRDMRSSKSASRPQARTAGIARRPRASRGEFQAACGALASWAVRACVDRPGGTAGSVLAAGAAIYVSLNALGFQAGRHPAPILPQPTTERVAAAAPDAPKPSVEAKAAVEAARERAEPVPPRDTAHAAAPRDGIADLIRDADDTTASVTPKPDKAVMRAQRALSKLGYGPLKDDGVMGAGTKAALVKFERQRKLPVTGEASGRTLRELASRAGQTKG